MKKNLLFFFLTIALTYISLRILRLFFVFFNSTDDVIFNVGGITSVLIVLYLFICLLLKFFPIKTPESYINKIFLSFGITFWIIIGFFAGYLIFYQSERDLCYRRFNDKLTCETIDKGSNLCEWYGSIVIKGHKYAQSDIYCTITFNNTGESGYLRISQIAKKDNLRIILCTTFTESYEQLDSYKLTLTNEDNIISSQSLHDWIDNTIGIQIAHSYDRFLLYEMNVTGYTKLDRIWKQSQEKQDVNESEEVAGSKSTDITEPTNNEVNKIESPTPAPGTRVGTRWVTKRVECPTCGGSSDCTFCGGFGWASYDPNQKCPNCHGDGKCRVCNRTGFVERNVEETYYY